jgi:ATP/maltotriose-dependent transcriptional regulator MalT
VPSSDCSPLRDRAAFGAAVSSTLVSAGSAGNITRNRAPCPGADALSARELGVLQLIAQGCSNQEISERLFISLHTVKTHASHINSKLGVERRTQAVARAQELGLLSDRH